MWDSNDMFTGMCLAQCCARELVTASLSAHSRFSLPHIPGKCKAIPPSFESEYLVRSVLSHREESMHLNKGNLLDCSVACLEVDFPSHKLEMYLY